MFTGLVIGKGLVRKAEASGDQTRLAVEPLFDMPGVALGESIAVNGACLTVEEWAGGAFTAYASAETMSRTNLGELGVGSQANLERALAMGDRLGGHMVSGHVDCLARVADIRPAGESRIFRFSFPREYGHLVVAKGSVALDGISLTVNECGPDFLTVNIIPSTLEATTMGSWKKGRAVNMETDVLGKYVLNMLGPYLDKAKGGGLSRDFLAKHGF